MRKTKERAMAIVIDKLGVEENQVTDSANFSHDLGADSLDTVELGMELEREFDISLAYDEWESVKTFGEAVALIENKLK